MKLIPKCLYNSGNAFGNLNLTSAYHNGTLTDEDRERRDDARYIDELPLDVNNDSSLLAKNAIQLLQNRGLTRDAAVAMLNDTGYMDGQYRDYLRRIGTIPETADFSQEEEAIRNYVLNGVKNKTSLLDFLDFLNNIPTSELSYRQGKPTSTIEASPDRNFAEQLWHDYTKDWNLGTGYGKMAPLYAIPAAIGAAAGGEGLAPLWSSYGAPALAWLGEKTGMSTLWNAIPASTKASAAGGANLYFGYEGASDLYHNYKTITPLQAAADLFMVGNGAYNVAKAGPRFVQSAKYEGFGNLTLNNWYDRLTAGEFDLSWADEITDSGIKFADTPTMITPTGKSADYLAKGGESYVFIDPANPGYVIKATKPLSKGWRGGIDYVTEFNRPGGIILPLRYAGRTADGRIVTRQEAIIPFDKSGFTSPEMRLLFYEATEGLPEVNRYFTDEAVAKFGDGKGNHALDNLPIWSDVRESNVGFNKNGDVVLFDYVPPSSLGEAVGDAKAGKNFLVMKEGPYILTPSGTALPIMPIPGLTTIMETAPAGSFLSAASYHSVPQYLPAPASSASWGSSSFGKFIGR